MPKKTAILSVINDLVTDQRIDRTAKVLLSLGYEVQMVGRRKSDSPGMPERPYATERMRLLWEKGPLFYAEFNIRLFFYLLFHRAQLLVSNDLDTLLPNYLIHKIFRCKLVYDSHEYFTGTPEVIHRPFVMKTWKLIEKLAVPGLKNCITVNSSIAGLFREEYGKEFVVVRNIPDSNKPTDTISRDELGLPPGKKIIILQGSGINIQRGAEEAVEAMRYLDDCLLLIVGGGDVINALKQQASRQELEGRVMFIPRQTPDKLFHYTCNADLGLSLDKDTNINYRFSLPNKLFDYIHAGIPVLASPLPEIKKIITTYQVGDFIDTHDPRHIAEKIHTMLSDRQQYLQWKINLQKASEELSWENEQKVLVRLFSQL